MVSFINALPGALSQGLIWGIMAIGVYITYKILDVADLSVDGSFCTGGAVGAMLLLSGWNPFAALLGAFISGLLAGLVTGLLHTKCGIPAILAGILTQMGLYSINLAVMGMKATAAVNVDKLSLIVSMRYLSDVADGIRPFYMYPLIVIGLFTAVIVLALYWFFGTEMGSALRATGANSKMARAQGINTNFNIVLGLALSNGLVALSGALLAQYNGFAEINMGKGAIVIGLAAIVISQSTFGRLFHNFGLKLMSVSLGSVLYYVVIQFVISVLKINANYLKLLSAIIVAVFLTVPYVRDQMRSKGRKEKRHA